MRHMSQCHEEAVIAHAGLLAFAGRTMNRHTLANRRAVSDDGIALLALKLQILRVFSNRSPLEDLTVPADTRPAADDDMRPYLRPLFYLDVFADDGIWTDLHILLNVCAR